MSKETIIKVDKFFMYTNLFFAVLLACTGNVMCFFNLFVAFVCWYQYTSLEDKGDNE